MIIPNRLLILLGVGVISLQSWSLVTVRHLYREEELQLPAVQLTSLYKARDLTLQDGRKPLAGLGMPGRMTILFFYSPFDCPQAIEELEELESLHHASPEIDIRAVAFSESQSEVKGSVQRFGLTFPVYPDPDARLRNLLRPPQTPWKVVVGPTGYRVLAEDPPSITDEEKKAFHYRALYLFRALHSEHAGPI